MKYFLWKTWFWIKIFSKKLDFEWKSFRKKHDFEKKVFHRVRFGISFLQRARVWVKNFTTREISNQFFLQRVRFWIENFTLNQILSVLLLQFAKFSCVYHNRPRFRNVLRYSVGSVSQVILLG